MLLIHNIDFRNEDTKLLSNLYPHAFVFRKMPCNSVEGILQGLKVKDPRQQSQIFLLSGFEAKKSGKEIPWWETQTLWWQGKEIDRHSDEYQDLLDEIYIALFARNDVANKALIDTGDKELTHAIGNSNPNRTILTTNEFVTRLTLNRKFLLAEKFVEF